MRSLVAEEGAVDAVLSAVIGELPPNKDGVSLLGAEDDLLAGTDEEFSAAAVARSPRRVVPLVEGEAGTVTVLGEPPERT